MTARHRTLWSAIDQQRSRLWLWAGYLVAGVALLAAVLWFWGSMGFRGGGFRLVAQLAAMVLSVAAFPLLRRRAARSAVRDLGAIPLPEDTAPETRRALGELSLARGKPAPDLWLFYSDSVNAIATHERGKDRIVVTTGFASLPVAEQRAGIAMLLGRNTAQLDGVILAAGGMPTDSDGNPAKVADLTDPRTRSKAVASWLAAAIAGDQEGLLLTKDPTAMMTLLKRLSSADTFLLLDSLAASYCCLAWPFGGDGKLDAGDDLPPKAREALAQFLGQGGQPGAYPELTRLAALREVLPVAERDCPEPVPVTPDVKRVLEGSAPESHALDDALPAQTQVLAATLGGAAVAASIAAGPEPARPAPPKPVVVTGPRIARTCPHCGARNVPTNASCIACGKPLPAAATG